MPQISSFFLFEGRKRDTYVKRDDAVTCHLREREDHTGCTEERMLPSSAASSTTCHGITTTAAEEHAVSDIMISVRSLAGNILWGPCAASTDEVSRN